jgi:hypothetical protein
MNVAAVERRARFGRLPHLKEPLLVVINLGEIRVYESATPEENSESGNS